MIQEERNKAKQEAFNEMARECDIRRESCDRICSRMGLCGEYQVWQGKADLLKYLAEWCRGRAKEVIKEEKDLEVLLTLREVAKGTSNTILYQLPRVFESKVAELLGGSSPGEIIKLFSEENKKYLVNVIQETIENLKKTSGGQK